MSIYFITRIEQKKKPHKELLFYWSIQELECVVQGNSPSVVIAAICVLDVPSVFAVEGNVLLESNVAEYVPELQIFICSDVIEEVGCIVSVSAEVSVSADFVVSNVQSEGARFGSVEGAVADASLVSAVVLVSVGVPVFTEYAEVLNRNNEVCAPDAVELLIVLVKTSEVEVSCVQFSSAEVIAEAAESSIFSIKLACVQLAKCCVSIEFAIVVCEFSTIECVIIFESAEYGEVLTAENNGGLVTYHLYASDTYPVDITDAGNLLETYLTHTEYEYTPISPWRQKRYFAVTAADRFGNESAPLELNAISETDMPLLNDGDILTLPEIKEAKTVKIFTATGEEIKYFVYAPQMSIASLPGGFYTVYILNNAGAQTFVGTIVK